MPKNQKSQTKNRKQSDGAKLLKQAGKAAQEVAREAQRRLPADMMRQLERNAGDVQKGLAQALKQLQSQLGRSRADVEGLGRRLDSLVERISALERGERPPAGRRRSASSTPSRRRRATAESGAEASPRPAGSRRSSSRRSTSTATGSSSRARSTSTGGSRSTRARRASSDTPSGARSRRRRSGAAAESSSAAASGNGTTAPASESPAATSQ